LGTACKPRNQGGLGILDIQSQNDALLMKFLDKFYNNVDLPWVNLTWSKLYENTHTPPHARSLVGSFWWKDVLKLFDKFKSFTVCILNKGNSVQLWANNWSGSILKNSMPQLFSFTRKPKCSITFLVEHQQLERIFSLPLSEQVAQQLTDLQELLEAGDLDENINDRWTYT